MAYSYVTYAGDGATTDFTVSFPYIDTDDVKGYVDGVEETLTWLTSTSVRISPAPAVGTTVRIERITALAAKEVDFVDGSSLGEADLDLSADQLFFAMQEARDSVADTIKKDTYDTLQWDAENKRIINVVDPVNPQDAATKEYVDTGVDSGVIAAAASATAAAASASAASTSATNASNSASNAATSATNAANSATTATTQAGIATTQAGNASTYATNAANSATAAANSAASASGSASSAASSASTATSKATSASTSAASADSSATDAAYYAAAAAAAVGAAEGISDMGVGNVNYPLVHLPLKRNLTEGDFTGSLTFARTGTAMYIDRYGFVKEAATGVPRFEKDGLLIEGVGAQVRSNSLMPSHFGLADWSGSKVNAMKYQGEAPDGSWTAVKLNEANSDVIGAHYLSNTDSFSYTAGNTYSCSVFAKAGERSVLRLNVWNIVATECNAVFDLSNGTVYSVGAGANFATIEPVRDGWYRCSFTFTADASTATNPPMVHVVDSLISTYPNYVGLAGQGIYIWGYQFEEQAFSTSLMKSTETFTSRASSATYWDNAGVLQTAAIDVARTSYNPADLSAPAHLMLEQPSTNKFLYSEDLSDAVWTKNQVTLTADAIAAPDGNTTADLIVETAVDTQHFVAQAGTTAMAIGEIAVASVFAKDGGRQFQFRENYIATDGFGVLCDPSNGSIELSYDTANSVLDYGVQDCGNGWYRFWVLFIATKADVPTIRFQLYNGNGSYLGDSTSGVYLWGHQIEYFVTGPTSYIPTTSAEVTRSSDVWSSAVGTRGAETLLMDFADNHPSLQPGNGYSYVVDVKAPNNAGSTGERTILDGNIVDTGADRYSLLRFNSAYANRMAFYRGTGVTHDTGKAGVKFRAGVVVSPTETVDLFVDGVQKATAAGVTLNSDAKGRIPASIGIGCRASGTAMPLYGHISNVRIYDRALNDFEMRIA